MIDIIIDHVLPAVWTLLPDMASPAADAMLVAIGLQESRFLARNQFKGPARGFWQFEKGGVFGVRTHPKTSLAVTNCLEALCYPIDISVDDLHETLANNDVLAGCFARCLMFTVPINLPAEDDAATGWRVYNSGWRPGAPRRETWDALFVEAWQRTKDRRT